MKRTQFVPFLALLWILFLCGCESDTSILESGKEVKVGVIVPLSGPSDKMGQNALFGVKTAIEVQPLLMNGDRVVLVVEDDGNDPLRTKECFRKVVEEDNVSAVLILSDSDAVLEALSSADSLKTPVIVTNATHPDITRSEWVVQVPIDDRIQGSVAATYIIDELFIDHVAILQNSESVHSVMLTTEFQKRFEDSGGEVDVESFENNPPDLKTLLSSLHKREVKLLYLPIEVDLFIKVKNELRRMRWNPRIMVSDGVLGLVALAPGENIHFIEGVQATDAFSASMKETKYGALVSSVYKKITEDYKQPGTGFAGLACEGTSLLLRAMDHCGGRDVTNRECINSNLRMVREFNGLAGKISVQADGKIERPIFINTIENGRVRYLVKIF